MIKMIAKVLYSIDKNFNEDFFKFSINKGHSAKSTPTIKADYWNAMSEAVSLRATQQHLVK